MLDGNTFICKLIVVTNYYFELAMYHWLLVEGIYLYIMVGLVFNSDRIKMWMYKVIGWGLPLIHSLIFCLMMRSYNDTTCWFVGDSSINWTRRGPILFILAFNLLILLHIIRILMTQMQTGQLNHDSNQVKKAIKATLVLSPLLGITYIVLLVSPGKWVQYLNLRTIHADSASQDDKSSYSFLSFVFINILLQGFQGSIVSIFYCFANQEIQRVLKRKFYGLQRQISNKRAVSVAHLMIY